MLKLQDLLDLQLCDCTDETAGRAANSPTSIDMFFMSEHLQDSGRAFVPKLAAWKC